MNQKTNNRDNQSHDDDELSGDAHAAYEPPRIVESARFETIASGCGYDFQCSPQPISG